MPSSRISIKQEWDAVDRADADVESRKWALAKRLADRYDQLGNYTKLAEEVKRGRATVQRWVKAGQAPARGRSFAEALAEAEGTTSEAETARKDLSGAGTALRKATPEQIDQVLDKLPDDRLAEVADRASQLERERYEADVRTASGESELQRKAREARQAKGRKRLDIFVILTSLKTATTDLRSTLALIREAELNEDEIGKVQHFVGRTRGALELIETALETEGASDWDAALAELEVQS